MEHIFPLESPDGHGCLKESFTPRSPWVLLVLELECQFVSCLLPALRWVHALGGYCLLPVPMAGPACPLSYTLLPVGPENMGEDLLPHIPPLTTPLQVSDPC
jgi:hypothetical protein